MNNTRFSFQLINAAFGGFEVRHGWIDRHSDDGRLLVVDSFPPCLHETALCWTSIRTTGPLVGVPCAARQAYVGPGAAVFINHQGFTYRLINFKTSPFTWFVSGTGVLEELP